MRRAPKKVFVSQDGEAWVEVLSSPPTGECFITVARNSDMDLEERVAVLTKNQALEMAAALLGFARRVKP